MENMNLISKVWLICQTACLWRSLSCLLDCTALYSWPSSSSDSWWTLWVGLHICNTANVEGRCHVGGANASPLAGHAVALKAKLNPRGELWQGVHWLQDRLSHLCWEDWEERWKEFIKDNVQTTRRSAQPCAIWEMALLMQLLMTCSLCPSISSRLTDGCSRKS